MIQELILGFVYGKNQRVMGEHFCEDTVFWRLLNFESHEISTPIKMLKKIDKREQSRISPLFIAIFFLSERPDNFHIS